MFNPLEFYHGFQVNHFDYKQINNHFLLNLPEDQMQPLIDEVFKGTKEEFLRSVKSDIRLTFLLSIETLFELIFGLLPDDNNHLHDYTLIKNLVKKIPYYEEIRKFNKGEKSKLDWLQEKVKFGNGETGPFIRHLFYCGQWKNNISESIQNSLPVIEQALRILAQELTHREELNSYKHGLRNISALKSLSILDVKTHKEHLKFDLNDSVTIYSYNKKKRLHEFLTKQFDPERDIALTHFASNLINNIIQPRKTLHKTRNHKGGDPLMFFYEEDLERASKVNVKLQDLKYTITEEHNKQRKE